MKKLYQKSEILFAIFFIVLYVVGCSYADQMPIVASLSKSTTVVFQLVLSGILLAFLHRNDLMRTYGLCRSEAPARKVLWYLPLILLSTVNAWFGLCMNFSAAETVAYVICMILAGFLEEIIFRGLLFRAMCKDNVKTAVIVSSLTFGMGHIVNLINGHGESLAAGLCQVCYAAAIGFVFVILFDRGKSLWPCIITHSVFNALSTFANGEMSAQYRIPVSIVLVVVGVGYACYLMKVLPKTETVK